MRLKRLLKKLSAEKEFFLIYGTIALLISIFVVASSPFPLLFFCKQAKLRFTALFAKTLHALKSRLKSDIQNNRQSICLSQPCHAF